MFNQLFQISESIFAGDDEKLAEFLIKKGAHVNHSNNKGETPLHYAAKLGKLSNLFFRIKHKGISIHGKI